MKRTKVAMDNTLLRKYGMKGKVVPVIN